MFIILQLSKLIRIHIFSGSMGMKEAKYYFLNVQFSKWMSRTEFYFISEKNNKCLPVTVSIHADFIITNKFAIGWQIQEEFYYIPCYLIFASHPLTKLVVPSGWMPVLALALGFCYNIIGKGLQSLIVTYVHTYVYLI